MEFLLAEWLGKPVWMWLGFHLVVAVLLAFDLGVLQKKTGDLGVKESLLLSAFYITLGLIFGLWVWWYISPQAGLEYLTGFVIEKSLSMDNVFVIAMIFGYFAIPRRSQYRVLFWGILAVIVLRGLMIGIGAALVQQFGWVLYIFAAFLVFTGVKMLFTGDDHYDIENNPIYKFMRKRFRLTDKLEGEAFFVRKPHPETGKMLTYMTPLFVVLVMVNVADMIFAVELGAGDLRHHHRHVHRVHVEHLRDPRPARPLLRAGGDGGAVQVPQVRARSGSGVHRRQDLRRRHAGPRQGSAHDLAGRHLRDPGRRA